MPCYKPIKFFLKPERNARVIGIHGEISAATCEQIATLSLVTLSLKTEEKFTKKKI